MKELEEQISATPDTTSHPVSEAESLNPSAPGGHDKLAKIEADKTRDLGRQSVQKEIEELKKRLGQRRLKDDIINDKGVEKAKGEVVRCLTIHDRKPLDCWQEVETFKKEVARLEKGFLGKIIE